MFPGSKQHPKVSRFPTECLPQHRSHSDDPLFFLVQKITLQNIALALLFMFMLMPPQTNVAPQIIGQHLLHHLTPHPLINSIPQPIQRQRKFPRQTIPEVLLLHLFLDPYAPKIMKRVFSLHIFQQELSQLAIRGESIRPHVLDYRDRYAERDVKIVEPEDKSVYDVVLERLYLVFFCEDEEPCEETGRVVHGTGDFHGAGIEIGGQ